MKRSVLILVIAISCLQSKAQSEFKRELNIGIGAGPTFSSLSLVPMNTNSSVDTKNTMQFHGGLSVRYITEKHFGLIGEINYAQMGWEGKFEEPIIRPEGSEGEFSPEHKHTLNYLEIPLLTHIYFGSDKTRFFVNLGPKIAFLLGDKEVLNDDLKDWIGQDPFVTDAYPSFAHYNKEPENKIDYGITAGLGIELRTKVGYFTLEGRYYMGFGDIYKNQKGEAFSRSANREMSARLTYYINIFK